MFCGNCGAKLNGDESFCPNCGAGTRIGQQEEASQEHPAEMETVNVPEQEAKSEAPTERPKHKWSPRKKFFAGAIAIVVVVIIIGIIGSSGNNEIIEVIEANNSYGLSTTVSVNEFVDYYNKFLSSYYSNELGRELDDASLGLLGGLDLDSMSSENTDDGDFTYYHWNAPLDPGNQEIAFWADNDTGYIVQAAVAFSPEAVTSAPDPDSALESRSMKMAGVMFAFCGGDADAFQQISEIRDNNQSGGVIDCWERNVSIRAGFTQDERYQFYIFAITEDAYKEFYQEGRE